MHLLILIRRCLSTNHKHQPLDSWFKQGSNMRKTSVLWFLLLLLIILMYGSTLLTAEAHSQKQPKVMRGMIIESNKAGNQRTYPGLHVVQHTTIRRAKAVYGGANDIRHPRGRNSANSLSIKHTSLFVAALRHLIFGLLLVVWFF